MSLIGGSVDIELSRRVEGNPGERVPFGTKTPELAATPIRPKFY